MCMSSPVVVMMFTEESLVVVLENGMLVEYNIEEILGKVGIETEKEAKAKRRRSFASTIFRLAPDAMSFAIPLSELQSRHEDEGAESTHFAYDFSPSASVASISCYASCVAFNEDYLFVAKDDAIFVGEVDCIAAGGSFHASKLTLSGYKPRHFSDYQLHCLLEAEETITDSHLVMAHAWPLYVVGTSRGRVFVVPLAAAHAIRCLDAGTSDAVSCLLYYRSSLISCSVGGSVQIWSLSMAQLKKSEGSGSSLSSDSGQPIDTNQHLPIKTFKIPYEHMQVLKQPHSLHEVLEGTSDNQWFDRWRYWQMLLVGQNDDDTVVLISLERGNTVCAFYGVKGRMMDAHVNVLLDYLFLNCSDGDCYIFNMGNQQLERVVSSTSLPFKSFRRPHATSFQEDPEEIKSIPHQLLEFNIIGMAAHHSQALVWVEYPVLGGVQLPVLCLNVGMIVESFQEMMEFPEQAEFVISMLNCWVKGSEEEDGKLQEQLELLFHARKPSVIASVGVFGLAGAISFRLPGDCSRWGISSYVSSLVSACLYSVLDACMHFSPQLHPLLSRSAKSHIARISARVKRFQRPSPLVFAIEVLNGNKVAYKLMRSAMDQFTQSERTEMMKEWVTLYQSSMPLYEPHTQEETIYSWQPVVRPLKRVGFIEALSAVSAGVLHLSGGIEYAGETELVSTYVWMLRGSRFHFVQAASLVLRDGIKRWRKPIGRELFVEATLALLNLHYSGSMSIRDLARKALMAVGKADVQTFLDILKHEVTKLAGRRDYPESVLRVLESFIEKHSPHTLFFLPALLEVILRSLDPREILLRKICVGRATEALELMVKRYPMVAFEPGHQLAAVGSSCTKIFVYDLKTGMLLHELEGHTGPVSLVEFSPKGTQLLSYSTSEMMVRTWRVEEGFFGGLTIRLDQAFLLPAVSAHVRSTRELLRTLKAEWTAANSVLLTREDGEAYSLSFP